MTRLDNEKLLDRAIRAVRVATFVECEALIACFMDAEWESTCDLETDTYVAYTHVMTAIRMAKGLV